MTALRRLRLALEAGTVICGIAALITIATPVKASAPAGWTLHAQFLIRLPSGAMQPLALRSTAPMATEEECARKALDIRQRVPIGMVATNSGGVVVAMRFRCAQDGVAS
jgi:hypothetical protein